MIHDPQRVLSFIENPESRIEYLYSLDPLNPWTLEPYPK